MTTTLSNPYDDQITLFAICATTAMAHWEEDPAVDYGDLIMLANILHTIIHDLPGPAKNAIIQRLFELEKRL